MRTIYGAILAAFVGTLVIALVWAGETKTKSNKARTARAEAAASKAGAKSVSVYVFDKEGKLVGPVESPRLELTRYEWRKRLTAEQYAVLRSNGTEPAFCGNLLDNKKQGAYTCAGCGLPLFSSSAKFDSGTGWPSFMRAVAKENIESTPDFSDGTPRIAIHCARCQGHLGHVFGDGPAPTGQRFCLNSAALGFTPSDKLADLADPAAEKPKERESDKPREKNAGLTATATESAVFAGGCFWCLEVTFEQLKGVLNVESGYCGGTAETADYEQVHGGATRHAEAIRVTYDPAAISFEQLLDVFFDSHDPTQRNRQGPDAGRQYRSAIFVANDDQKQAAEEKIRELQTKKVYRRAIQTRLEPIDTFYPAEAAHQDYVRNNPFDPYVQTYSIPKAEAVKAKHPDLIGRP